MFLDGEITYDGHILHSRFAYHFFREECCATGDMLVFRGPMQVEADAMLDQEDIINKEFIYAEDAINFLWEIPCLASPFGAVAYQRLLNGEIAEILSDYLQEDLLVEGDDILVQHNKQFAKASVSITYVTQQVTLGHTGINILAGSKAPKNAYSTQLSDENIQSFVGEVLQRFYQLNQELFIATSKVLV